MLGNTDGLGCGPKGAGLFGMENAAINIIIIPFAIIAKAVNSVILCILEEVNIHISNVHGCILIRHVKVISNIKIIGIPTSFKSQNDIWIGRDIFKRRLAKGKVYQTIRNDKGKNLTTGGDNTLLATIALGNIIN